MDPEGAMSSHDGSANQSPLEGIAPMSDFNSHALAALQGRLSTKVMMSPQLFNMLEVPQGGFMSTEEAMDVRSNASPMGRLIEILRGKTDKEFDTFCDMLEKSNYPAWANELKQEAERLKMLAQIEVSQRKRSPSSASSRETPAKKKMMDEYVKTKTDVEMQDVMSMQDCKAVVPVVPLDYDVEVNDHHYLEKAMKKACKNREQDPRVLMKALYANTFDCVEDILVRNEQHSESIVRAARTTIRLQLAEGDAKALTTTLTVSELLEKLCISTKWDDTFLLERIVGCLPKEAKTLAMSLLDRYDSYLDVYDEAVKVKDSLKNATASPELTKAHIPVEVTLAKDVSETTLKDCKEMLAQLLCKAFKIPRTSITATEARSGSTTIICIVDKAFMMNVVKYSGEASALWAYQELSVTRIQIPGLFEVNVSQLLTQYFMEALRSGLTGDMDFVGATKALPQQVYALVDLGRTDRLLVPSIRRKIVRHWPEQEESVSDTANNEGVEPSAETTEGRLSPNVEEETETMEVGKENEAATNMYGKQLSHVQVLEDELKDSEQKRMDLIHGNTALQIKLKASQEENDHIHQEMASLQERLLSVLSSQVEQPPPPPAPPSAPPPLLPPLPEYNVEAEVKELVAEAQKAEDEKAELEMENSALRKELVQQADNYKHQMELISQSLPTSDNVTMVMLEAAANGDQSVLQLLVKRFVNVEDKDGRTPLLLAAERGHTDLVRLLAGHYEGDIFHIMKNSQNALHLATYRGHLPVLQYLCPMFGDRVLDRDGKDETCLNIARRLGRETIANFLTQNYPQLEGKGGAGKDPSPTASSVGPSKRVHHPHWWRVSAGSRAISPPPSSPMEQAEGTVEMKGEVEFRRDDKSNTMKAVSGTEWMYRRGALERGRQAAVTTFRQHRFSRYHQRWLADYVQTEEEESCEQWLLHQSPEVSTVREAEKYMLGRVGYRYATGVGLSAKEWASHPTQRIRGSTIIKLQPMSNALQVISSVMLEDDIYISGIAPGPDIDRVATIRQVQLYSCNKGAWSTLPETPNFNAPLSVINGHITLIGGRDTETQSISNILCTWSAEKHQWEQIIPPMPSGRLGSGACYHDNLLLVTGGIEESTEGNGMLQAVSTVHVYSLSTRLWSTPKALELPQALRSHHVVVLEKYVYLTGGAIRYPSPPEEGEDQFNSLMWRARWSDIKGAVNEAEAAIKQVAHAAADLQSPKPVKNVWTPIAAPPVIRSTVISCKNSLISVGGVKGGVPQSAIYMFVDGKVDNNWVKVGNMSEGRYRHAVVPARSGTALFVASGFVMDEKWEEANVKSTSAELVIL